jgi:hypothetical protein
MNEQNASEVRGRRSCQVHCTLRLAGEKISSRQTTFAESRPFSIDPLQRIYPNTVETVKRKVNFPKIRRHTK